MPNIKDKTLFEGVILVEYNKEKASTLFVIHLWYYIPTVLKNFTLISRLI